MGSDPVRVRASYFRNWRCLFGLVAVVGTHLVWEVLNRAPAIWDMAYHQIMGLSYLEALRQGTIFSEFASLSPAYPPLYYLHEAAVYLLLPSSQFQTLVVNVPYILLTSWATYRIAIRFSGFSTAGWASVLVLLFPALAMVHREALLDGALAAWVTCGAWLILRSRWFESAGWTLLFGFVCALGALTKWTFPLYLAVPVLFGLAASHRPWRAVRNLTAAGLVALALIIPYYGPHAAAMVSRYPTTNQAGLIPWQPFPRHGEPGLNNLWGWIYYPRVLASYFLYLPLTLFFLAGLMGNRTSVPRAEDEPLSRRRITIFLWTWLLSGLFFLMFLTPKDPRFALPLAAPVAILLLHFWEHRPRIVQAIVAIALLQFLTFSLPLFGPVKIALFEIPGDRDFQSLQREWVLYANHYFHVGGPPVQENWGIAEILAAVPDGSSVAVLPTLPRFHAGALQLEAEATGRSVSFFDFNEGPHRDPLQVSDFVVAKTGYQGLSFITRSNPEAMRRLVDEGWQRVGEWPLPDGERAQLWKAPPA